MRLVLLTALLMVTSGSFMPVNTLSGRPLSRVAGLEAGSAASLDYGLPGSYSPPLPERPGGDHAAAAHLIATAVGCPCPLSLPLSLPLLADAAPVPGAAR